MILAPPHSRQWSSFPMILGRLVFALLLCLTFSCSEPTEPKECPIQWYNTVVRNAAGDSVGVWEVGIAFCVP